MTNETLPGLLLMKLFAVLISLFLLSFNASAAEQTSSLDSPLLKIEMNVETDGVAKSIDQVNDSMKELIVTLEQIARNKNLTPQQTLPCY